MHRMDISVFLRESDCHLTTCITPFGRRQGILEHLKASFRLGMGTTAVLTPSSSPFERKERCVDDTFTTPLTLNCTGGEQSLAPKATLT